MFKVQRKQAKPLKSISPEEKIAHQEEVITQLQVALVEVYEELIVIKESGTSG